jgi:ABC-type anion transport system duplicated permease subunit
LSERVILYFARRQDAQPSRMRKVHIMTWTFRASATLAMVGVLLAVVAAFRLLAGLSGGDLRALVFGALATFFRVLGALLIGTAWTVPAGVWIELNPRLARIAQPIAQIAASVPATALFPILLLVLIRAGGGLAWVRWFFCCSARNGMCSLMSSLAPWQFPLI